MEIALGEAVVITTYAFLQMLFHLQVAMDNEGTSWLNQFRVMTETLQIGFLCAIYVEVVRVGAGDDAHPRT